MNCLPSSVRAAFRRGKILGERRMVGIARIRLDGGHNRRRRDEAGDVIDVAMRIVASDAAVKPDHLIDTEILVKGLLQLLRG